MEREYDFSKISKQIPMAMSGAVSGSVYLEKKFNEILTGKLPYDYREDGERGKGEILDIRNQNLLFDWLSYKMGIKNVLDRVNKSVTIKKLDAGSTIDYREWSVTKIGNSKEDYDELKLNHKAGYKIILKKGASFITDIANYVTNKLFKNTKSEISIVKDDSVGEYSLEENVGNKEYILKHQNKELLRFTAEVKNGEINTKSIDINQLKVDELAKDFHLTKINSFPLNVFNELTYGWYKTSLPLEDLAKNSAFNIELKAAAEPKDPDIDRKDDGGEAVLVVEANHDYTCITRDSEKLHDIGRKDFVDHTNIELTVHEYHQPLVGCTEVEITA